MTTQRWMAMGRLILIGVLACVPAAASFGAQASERVQDDERGFTLTLPAGFVERPDLVDKEPTILRAWSRGSAPPMLIVIEDLGGPIAVEELVEYKPAGVIGQQGKRSWRGYRVEAFEVRETLPDGTDAVTFNVQIPLRSGGVQLGVFGPASQAAETEAILETVLASLDGASNWPRASAAAGTGLRGSLKRVRNLADGYEMFVLFGVVIVAGLIVVVLVRRASSGRL